jgi:hypothetical protein
MQNKKQKYSLKIFIYWYLNELLTTNSTVQFHKINRRKYKVIRSRKLKFTANSNQTCLRKFYSILGVQHYLMQFSLKGLKLFSEI